jgi:HEAT repeat protein
MTRAARTIGLFAPLLGVAAVAAGVVLTVLHAPVVVVGLAAAIVALGVILVAAAAAPPSGATAPAADHGMHAPGRQPSELAVRRAVSRLARQPGDVRARQEVARHLGSFDRIRAEADRLDQASADEVRRVLLVLGAAERLQRDADEGGRWERVAAARHLAWLAPADVVWRLNAIARDSDVEVALAGAAGLATLHESAAYRALVRLLGDGALPASRTATILEESVWTDPVGVLAQEVPGGSTPVRFWAAYLAGRSHDDRAADLVVRLAFDADPDVRANAAEALGAFRRPDALDTALRLSGDDVWYVRAHAARALGRLLAPAPPETRAIPEQPASDDPTLDPTLRATDTAGDRNGVRRLAALLADRSWWVREAAGLALAGLGDPAIPELRRVLASSDRFARNKAAEVLVGLGFVEREMRRYLAGRGQRRQARQSLVLLGRAEVLASLSARFLAADDEQRKDLALVLNEIDDLRLRPTLRALLGTPEPDDTAARKRPWPTRRGAERPGKGDES